MATSTALSPCSYSLHTNSQFNYRLPTRNRVSLGLRLVPKSSLHKDSGTSVETSSSPTSPQKEQPASEFLLSPSSDDTQEQKPFWRLRSVFEFDELALDIFSIAFPAALALAADPITSLVDTAFVGHLGSVELAAVGVSISVFNLVSKLFNVPLLNITTSFVAEEQALVGDSNDQKFEHKAKQVLPSASTSLALAAGLGLAEAVGLYFGSSFLLNLMGIPVDSPMRAPAEQFLSARALGAPAIVIALAAQGTFRGFKDTKTPLYAIGAGNLLNAILDFILIFLFDFGISGAAVATVISEYLIASLLLVELNGNFELVSPKIDWRSLLRYLKSGGLLIGRTVAVLGTITLGTSLAAKQGPVVMAGHQICIQIWLAVSLLTDALALAGQALLAPSYSQGDYEQSGRVVYRTLQIGLATGLALGLFLFSGFGYFSSLFTTDVEVLQIAWSGTLFVAGSQPVNAVAFVLDGLYYGVSDFAYAAYSMVLVGVVSSVFLLVASPRFGLPGVWAGLFLFMSLRVVAGIWRLGFGTGPWKHIWSKKEQEGG